MTLPLIHVILLVLPLLGFCAERGQQCTTPNGENATCTPLSSCNHILQAILTLNDTAREFAKSSQCGFDSEPLLCCGSTAFPVVNVHSPISNLLPNRSVCGTDTTIDKIVGGQLTDVGEFPWMALLGYKDDFSDTVGFKCGGTLINNRYVLTAAHCIRVSPDAGLTLEVVRLGENQISSDPDCVQVIAYYECADPVVDLKIELKIPHPNYSKKTGDNDIGLLRLERNVEYTDFIRPICLPSFNAPPAEPGTRLVVAGWGSTENGSASDYKLKLEVPVVAASECMTKIKNRGKISDNQICAGGETGKDSCQGDSGGPLMGNYGTMYDRKQWYQEGITAWGIGCASRNIPAVYTRVAKYMGWILDNMSEF